MKSTTLLFLGATIVGLVSGSPVPGKKPKPHTPVEKGGRESDGGRRWWRYDGEGWYRRCEWAHDKFNKYSIVQCRNQDDVWPGNNVFGPALGSHWKFNYDNEDAPKVPLYGPWKWGVSGKCNTNSEYCADGSNFPRPTFILVIDDTLGPRYSKCTTMPHGSNYYAHLNSYCPIQNTIAWADIPVGKEIEGLGFKLDNSTEPMVPGGPNGTLVPIKWPIQIGHKTVGKPRDPPVIHHCKGNSCGPDVDVHIPPAIHIDPKDKEPGT